MRFDKAPMSLRDELSQLDIGRQRMCNVIIKKEPVALVLTLPSLLP